MRKEINKTVAGNYARYANIRSASKRMDGEHLLLRPDKHRANQQVGESPVVFEQGEEGASLRMALDVERTKKFAFQLFCKQLMPDACYRFDSDGHCHRNPATEGTTLLQRQVPTPHFHAFDEQGREIAYKTERLRAEEQQLLADYNEALHHFCEEENVEVSPHTQARPDTLALGTCDVADPLKGVKFT